MKIYKKKERAKKGCIKDRAETGAVGPRKQPILNLKRLCREFPSYEKGLMAHIWKYDSTEILSWSLIERTILFPEKYISHRVGYYWGPSVPISLWGSQAISVISTGYGFVIKDLQGWSP